MKNYTFTTLVVLLLSTMSFAQEAPAPAASSGMSNPVSLTSGDIDSIASDANLIVTQNSNTAAYENYVTAYNSARVNYPAMESLLPQVQGISSAGQAQALASQVQEAVTQCKQFVENANQCCTQPETCGGGGNKFSGLLEGTAQMAPMIAGLMGAGGVASCLQALPGLVDGLSFSEGMSKACQMLRNGPNVQTGSSQGQKPGCVQVCNTAKQIIGGYRTRVQQLISSGEVGLTTAMNDATRLMGEVDSSQSTCNSRLTQGEAQADAQSESNQQTQNSAMQCAQDFLNEDDEVAEEDLESPNIQDPAYSDLALGGDGSYQKLNPDNSFLGTTDGSEDDDILPPDPRAPAGGAGQKAGAQQPMMGGMGGGSGGGENPSEKTGGAPRGKSDSLISGYAKSKGGSSGSGGAGSPKKWGNFFKKEKDAKDADKNGALAALSKLVKAGISPNTSGSIFERVTQRFVASSAKENMFDAKTNKKLWMNKK